MNPAPKNRPERLQQSEQLRRAVYDVPGAALLQLGTRAEPPRDARRTDAGGGGRLHVHPRIAHVEHLAGGDARRSQYFADDRRIGFERHVGTLSQNHVEADVGEIAADELLGAGLFDATASRTPRRCNSASSSGIPS